MKNRNLKLFITTISTAMVMAGCGGLGKMVKNANTITYDVSPKPLEMHGDSIAISITGKYPPKFFHKNAQVAVTPVLKYGDSEREFRSVNFKGEKSPAEGTVINFEKGGSISYTDKIPYSPEMKVSELHLRANASIKTKSRELGTVKLADGVIVTPLLVMNDDKPTLGVDKFTKTVPRVAESKINFLIQQSNIRATELTKPDMKALIDFIKKGVAQGFIFNSVDVSAYASPDGEERLNAGLAERRAEETAKHLAAELRKLKVEAAKSDAFFKKTSTPEDWDGFRTLVEQSEIKDKDLILRVLTMYQDPMQREQEIKNMAATYTVLADKILPELRRSKIRVNAEEKSRSDERILALVNTSPDSLSVEEILYAATLKSGLDEKINIYRTSERLYPNDWRGANNVGYILLLQNNLNEAQSQFEKADRLSANNPAVKNNLGVIAHLKGDRRKAKELYAEAAAQDANAKYNLGIINIKSGDYSSAVANMIGVNTFNAALAKTLSGNNEGAKTTLDASPDKDSAMGLYLRAVIAARAGNASEVSSNLKAAISKDPSLREKAKTDLEFAKYKANTDFAAAIN
jgi:tetratricopeptide (TPR) repeat protein